jgi:hypothetical protein
VAAGTLFLSAGAARADLTVVATVRVNGAAAQAMAKPRQQVVTTYYKANRIRTETGKTVSIYDTDTQQMYSLDPEKKTFRVTSLKNVTGTMAPGLLSKLKFNATADTREVAEEGVIAGKPARKYVCSATIGMSVEGMPQGSFPTTRIQIEQWATDAITLPGEAHKWALPLARMTGPLESMDGMKPLVEAMAKIKGFPLSNRITTTVVATPTTQAGIGRTPTGPVVTTTEVQSVSEEALSDALFEIPKDYTKVERAASPTTLAPPKASASHVH